MQLRSLNNNEIDYLIITNDELLETAKKLEDIHTDLTFRNYFKRFNYFIISGINNC